MGSQLTGVGRHRLHLRTNRVAEEASRFTKKVNPTVALKQKGSVFVRPELTAEIEFRAWTGDSKLRHASFKGMRDPEDHIEVYSLDNVEKA